MTLNPINLAVRFLLEVIMWLAVGFAAAQLTHPVVGVVATLAAIFLWSGFSVPGDGSRNKAALIAVPGPLRLLIEAFLFVSGIAALIIIGQPVAAGVFSLILIAHYLISYDRVLWLVNAQAFPAFGEASA